MAEVTAPGRRPGIITFIGVLILINGTVAAVSAVVAFVALAQGSNEFTDTQLWTAAIVETTVAALAFIVASYLMSGSKAARGFVTIVVVLRMIASAVVIVTHHNGGYMALGVIGAVFGVVILWALYVHEGAVAYFDASKIA